MKYVALDIGCIECGEDSHVLGIFNDIADACDACAKADKAQSANWHGQHHFFVEKVDVENMAYIPDYSQEEWDEEQDD